MGTALTPDSLGIQYGNGYHLQSLTKGEFITVWKVRELPE
jgi:hypothetical protein